MQQLNLEIQIPAGTGPYVPVAVSRRRRYHESTYPTNFHPDETDIPTLDHLPLAEMKTEIAGRIQDLAGRVRLGSQGVGYAYVLAMYDRRTPADR